jgi:hypothetical protein
MDKPKIFTEYIENIEKCIDTKIDFSKIFKVSRAVKRLCEDDIDDKDYEKLYMFSSGFEMWARAVSIFHGTPLDDNDDYECVDWTLEYNTLARKMLQEIKDYTYTHIVVHTLTYTPSL